MTGGSWVDLGLGLLSSRQGSRLWLGRGLIGGQLRLANLGRSQPFRLTTSPRVFKEGVIIYL